MRDKYIVCVVTGSIVNLADCYIIDGSQLDDTFYTQEVADLAEREGIKVSTLLEPKEYTVWVGGTEANDHYLTRVEAQALANEYISDGYVDVAVVRTSKNDEA